MFHCFASIGCRNSMRRSIHTRNLVLVGSELAATLTTELAALPGTAGESTCLKLLRRYGRGGGPRDRLFVCNARVLPPVADRLSLSVTHRLTKGLEPQEYKDPDHCEQRCERVPKGAAAL